MNPIPTWAGRGRLAGALALFALALLNVVPLTSMFYWRISLLTTEFGFWFLLPGWFILRSAGRRRDYLSLTLALSACAIFIAPLVEAIPLAYALPAQLENELGPLPPSVQKTLPAPLSLRPLVWAKSGPVVTVQTVLYDPARGLRLDFYTTDQSIAKPCIITLHGGGWNTGSRHELTGFDLYLAQTGYTVAALDYRLSPQATWPAPREDIQTALAYLQAHAKELGVDPDRFVLLGRSAGGQIVEAAAYELHNPAIRGCIAYYAPADLNLAFAHADKKDILDTYGLLTDYLGGTKAQFPQNYDDASSILQVHRDCPPTLLFHGGHDPLVWPLQSERLADKLTSQGVPHALIELPWATHAFDYNRASPGGQISAYAVRYFLAKVIPLEIPENPKKFSINDQKNEQ